MTIAKWVFVNYSTGEIAQVDEEMTREEAKKIFLNYNDSIKGFDIVEKISDIKSEGERAIEEQLASVRELQDLEDITEKIENRFNEVMDGLFHKSHEEISKNRYIISIEKHAKLVLNWINERLGSGYYANNKEVLEGLRSCKYSLENIINGGR